MWWVIFKRSSIHSSPRENGTLPSRTLVEALSTPREHEIADGNIIKSNVPAAAAYECPRLSGEAPEEDEKPCRERHSHSQRV